MAIRKVSRMGHPVLRQRAVEIPPPQMQSPQMQRLIDDMIETMIDYEGIGLAAPQVFESLRLIVLGDPAADPQDETAIPLTVLFNPQFTALSPERLDGWEGCLSIPNCAASSRARQPSRSGATTARSERWSWKQGGFSPASSSTKLTISTASSSQTAWPIYRPLPL